MPDLTHLISVALLVGASAGYAIFLARWLAPRITPAVPRVPATFLAGGAAALTVASAFVLPDLRGVTTVAAFAPLFAAAAFIDVRTKRIPNALIVHGLTMSVPLTVWAVVDGAAAAAGWAWGLSAAAFVVLLAMNVLSRGGFGMGDVKLGWLQAFAVTLTVTSAWGAVEWGSPVVVLLLAMCVIGLITVSFLSAGVVVLARGMYATRTGIPFGPHLLAGWAAVTALTPVFAAVAVA